MALLSSCQRLDLDELDWSCQGYLASSFKMCCKSLIDSWHVGCSSQGWVRWSVASASSSIATTNAVPSAMNDSLLGFPHRTPLPASILDTSGSSPCSSTASWCSCLRSEACSSTLNARPRSQSCFDSSSRDLAWIGERGSRDLGRFQGLRIEERLLLRTAAWTSFGGLTCSSYQHEMKTLNWLLTSFCQCLWFLFFQGKSIFRDHFSFCCGASVL